MPLSDLTDSELSSYYALYKSMMAPSKRCEYIKQYGFDTKYSYHIIRLCLESQQILETGNLDLRRDSDILKSIRRGEWTEEQVRKFFSDSEESMRKLYDESTAVPHSPDEAAIKELLVNCLEEHYGDLSSAVHIPERAENTVHDVVSLLKERGYV